MFPEYLFWQATVFLIPDTKSAIAWQHNRAPSRLQTWRFSTHKVSSLADFTSWRFHFLRLDSWGRNPADNDKAHRNKWDTKTKRKHIQAPVFLRLRTRNVMRKKGLSHARKMVISRSTPSNKWTKTFRFSYWISKASGMWFLIDSKTVTDVPKNRSIFKFNVNHYHEIQLNINKSKTHQKAQ
jgi:hypothetical protein